MEITALLCDAAEVVEGKLYILGGGWNVTGTPTRPIAVAWSVAVPWTSTNVRHEWVLELVDEDGRAVRIEESGPVSIGGAFEVGRPAGAMPGMAIHAPMTVSFPGLPIPPGRYEFRITVDGDPDSRQRLPFSAVGAG